MFQFKGVREGRRSDGQPYIDLVRSALRGVNFLEPQATASFNIASRVQAMADAAEVWITEAVRRYPGVDALLEPYVVEPHTAELHGIEQPMTVVRVRSREHAVVR